jgi:putative membrane protein
MLAITILALLAALLHIVFFVFESLLWTTPTVRKIFRQSEADAQTTRMLALNQGYYNLFLALAAIAGVVLLYRVDIPIAVGFAVLTVSLGSMVGASLVLLFSAGKKMIRGVLLQGLAPLVCLFLIWCPV